ncbi:MAG: 50S ribosomal protein L9 [Dichotomicrobium sp.]
MQIILLERVGKLGQMGDVVNVRDGHARNYLLPTGKALRATKENMARFERERAQIEARNLERRKEAETVGEKLDGQSFTVIRQSSESGQLYGSVSTRDIASLVSENGTSIERSQVLLDRPIKTLGLHEVRIQLHAEVDVHITLNVARSEDEAALQAKGQDVTATREETEYEHVSREELEEEFFEEGVEVETEAEVTGESPETGETEEKTAQ